MGLNGSRTFVGFGLGPIQAGLFLAEALNSGAFKRLVVAEVAPDLVNAVRQCDGLLAVNVAHADGLERQAIGPIEILNPAEKLDREVLTDAIAEADEIATALPSVDYYGLGSEVSVARLLAAGLREKALRGHPLAVIYTAENNNHAAQLLEEQVMAEVVEHDRPNVAAHIRFLNTVIGKMSLVVTDPNEIADYGLAPLTSTSHRAVLVETFNRILISRIDFDGGFDRGLQVFEEKEDLLPFEEAKLYGHNATHALGGYLGALAGGTTMSELGTLGLLPFLRSAFIEESGEALIQRHQGIDPLFTHAGYTEYADDLLIRMTNPLLHDRVDRITRDTERKLGWDDRLIGTMRAVLASRIHPFRYAVGAAAASASLDPAVVDHPDAVTPLLERIWRKPARDSSPLVDAIKLGLASLRRWRDSGFADHATLEHR